MEEIPKSSIDEAVKWVRKNGFSEHFIKRFTSEAIAESRYVPTSQAIDEAFKITLNATPGAGITPEIIKNFKFVHPTLWYDGIIILGYILSVLTVLLRFFSWIPSLVLGIYLAAEKKTRFHGIAIISIGLISMINS